MSRTNGNDRYERNEKRIRDAAIFLLGVAGSAHEIWVIEEPRPALLAFLASLLGLPFIMYQDAKRREKRERDGDGDGRERQSTTVE